MNEIVEIERMGYGVDAIAHASDGKTLFVAGGVPGDVVAVELTQNKKSYAKAKIVQLQQPSPHRTQRVELDAVESGATWAHLDYETQLAAKQANVADALRRVAKLDHAVIEKVLNCIVACKEPWGYRNKVELSAFRDSAGRFCLGAHELGSDASIPLKKAPLANRMINTAPKALTGVLRYLQGNGDLGIYRVGVRASVRTKSLEVALWTPPSSFPRGFAAKAIKDAIGATSVVRILAEPGSARRIKKVEVLEGCGHWQEKMGQKGADHADWIAYRISAPSFFQVNTAQAESLVALVLEGLDVHVGSHVADLYAGAGTFSLPLAQQHVQVSAIEIAGSSTRDLVRNAQCAKFDIDVICDDTARALPRLGALDALVVDPPRVGLEEKVITQIADAAPERIAYVSCDPQTFARDVKRLMEQDYILKSATPVDMFPQTYHVETVGILEKASIRIC